jgi:hypothetical protein
MRRFSASKKLGLHRMPSRERLSPSTPGPFERISNTAGFRHLFALFSRVSVHVVSIQLLAVFITFPLRILGVATQTSTPSSNVWELLEAPVGCSGIQSEYTVDNEKAHLSRLFKYIMTEVRKENATKYKVHTSNRRRHRACARR